ncbi:hypothetical protein HAX54_032007 [Datura stramonium]|uniref:Uncharacterized protein n=1 Tax=Datura stramonium TaxID=4076 RepID=A0ABS8VA08_DATST|nr:hypothetical protein [Datura stramonium]
MDIIVEAINQYYKGDSYSPINSSVYDEKQYYREDQISWLASIVSYTTPIFLTTLLARIFKWDLTLRANPGQVGVPNLPREDKYIKANQVMDINKINDEINFVVQRHLEFLITIDA